MLTLDDNLERRVSVPLLWISPPIRTELYPPLRYRLRSSTSLFGGAKGSCKPIMVYGDDWGLWRAKCLLWNINGSTTMAEFENIGLRIFSTGRTTCKAIKTVINTP